MKILYVGNYKDGTGWGNAAINYILALDSVGLDIVPRCIKLNNANPSIPTRILELEQQSSENCDIIIQHVLPPFMKFDGNFKLNIGLYVTETDSFIDSGWSQWLNCMDEVWVPNFQMIHAAKKSGVDIPIFCVPHTFDINKYTRSYEKFNIPNTNGNFIFYFIGEAVKRKNLDALLQAFHSEFNQNEPVSLVIKTTVPGQSPQQTYQYIQELCNNIKRGLKIYKHIDDYHTEHILPEYLSNEDIMRLHATCDCLVCTSYGEAWHIPAFEAMAMQKCVIANNIGGLQEFIIDKNTGLLVSKHLEPANNALDTFQDIYTANENWCSIDICELRQKMREVYTNTSLREKITKSNLDTARKFSYYNIGNLIKQRLTEIYNGK